MGKKRITVIGSPEEQDIKSKRATKLEQKKIREGKMTAKAPGLPGGQRIVDTSEESLREYEEIQKRLAATPVPESTDTPITPRRPVRIRSKTYQKAKSQINPDQIYPLPEALKLLRQVSLAKFDGTVELHLTAKNKGIFRTLDLPFSSGKIRRIAVADDKTITNIAAGNIDFDLLLASPDQMPNLVKFAKVLGPRGLMPNPKTGTIVADPATTATKLAAGNSLTLKTEKDAPVIHTIAGKLSQPDAELEANTQAIPPTLPPLSKAVLKSTMSPAIKLQL